MSKVLGFKQWRLFENDSKEKSVGSAALLVGATNHTAYNKSAGKRVNSDTSIEIADVDSLNDNKAISRKTRTHIKKFQVVEKSEKAKDYLKIGDIVLNGDGGNVEKVKVSLDEILRNDLEASGNGIYALCRAIEYAYKYKLGRSHPIHIVLNQPSKTPVVMFASSGKALGDPRPGWRGMVHIVATTGGRESVIVPTKENLETDGYSKRYQARAYDTMVNAANKFPTPRIFATTREEIIETRKDLIANGTQFDISEWAAKNKGKQIKNKDEAQKLMWKFCDSHFKKYLRAEGDRFILYLNNMAKKGGIDPELLSPVIAAANAWVEKWSGRPRVFIDSTRHITSTLFRKVTYTTGPAPTVSANTSTKDLEIGGF